MSLDAFDFLYVSHEVPLRDLGVIFFRFFFFFVMAKVFLNTFTITRNWYRGAMDNASAYGAEDCRFDPCRDRRYIFGTKEREKKKKIQKQKKLINQMAFMPK